MQSGTVLILGVNDLATAVALRLYRSGFSTILCASPNSDDLHNDRNFSGAIQKGNTIIDQIEAMILSHAVEYYDQPQPESVLHNCQLIIKDNKIPIIAFEEVISVLSLVNYIVKTDIQLDLTELEEVFAPTPIICFSELIEDVPGYLISLNNKYYGKVIYPFLKEQYPDPAPKSSEEKFYTVQAPLEGVFFAEKRINDKIKEKEVIGKINNIPILSPVAGRVTGISRSGHFLHHHSTFVEIDETAKIDGRILPRECFALAGGVLEAVLYDMKLQGEKGK